LEAAMTYMNFLTWNSPGEAQNGHRIACSTAEIRTRYLPNIRLGPIRLGLGWVGLCVTVKKQDTGTGIRSNRTEMRSGVVYI